MRIRAFVLVVGVLLVAAIPAAAHATPAGHRLTGTVSGTAVEVTDPTCPPNFLGVTPQRRLLITATVSGAMPHETITVGVCEDCCHPGGWDTNGRWAEIRTPAGTLRGIVRGGRGGYWGFSIGITMTSGTRDLAHDAGRNFSLIEPFNVNNLYGATGVIDPGTFLAGGFL